MELSVPQTKIVKRLVKDGIAEEKGNQVWFSTKERLDSHTKKLITRLTKREVLKQLPAQSDGRIGFTTTINL